MIWSKVKWVVLAIVSGLSAALAFIYGKRTPQVIRTKLRESHAREELLAKQLERAAALREQANNIDAARARIAKVGALEERIEKVREKREQYIHDSRDLPYISDDDLAFADNARARSAAAN